MKGTYNVYLKDHHVIDLYLKNSNNHIDLCLSESTDCIDLYIPGAAYLMMLPKTERMTLFQDKLKLSERMYIVGETNIAVLESDARMTMVKSAESENIIALGSMLRAEIASSISVEPSGLSLFVSPAAFELLKVVNAEHTFNISPNKLDTYTFKFLNTVTDINIATAIGKTYAEKSISVNHNIGFDSRIAILNHEIVGAEDNSLYLVNSVSAHTSRFRKLNDMDQHKLSDFDDMTLNDVDYVII